MWDFHHQTTLFCLTFSSQLSGATSCSSHTAKPPLPHFYRLSSPVFPLSWAGTCEELWKPHLQFQLFYFHYRCSSSIILNRSKNGSSYGIIYSFFFQWVIIKSIKDNTLLRRKTFLQRWHKMTEQTFSRGAPSGPKPLIPLDNYLSFFLKIKLILFNFSMSRF